MSHNKFYNSHSVNKRHLLGYCFSTECVSHSGQIVLLSCALTTSIRCNVTKRQTIKEINILFVLYIVESHLFNLFLISSGLRFCPSPRIYLQCISYVNELRLSFPTRTCNSPDRGGRLSPVLLTYDLPTRLYYLKVWIHAII